jgi:hypothetical protein
MNDGCKSVAMLHLERAGLRPGCVAWPEETRMAHYNRFEIYLPVRYRILRTDSVTGEQSESVRSLNSDQVDRFLREAVHRFGGATRAHPMGHPPYHGMWADNEQEIVVDDITYLFVLVSADQFQDAITFFDGWRREFATGLNQDVVLITHWPVQTIGEIG